MPNLIPSGETFLIKSLDLASSPKLSRVKAELCLNLTQINLQGHSTSLRVLLSVMSSPASKELINGVNPVGNSILILSEFV